MREKIKHIIKRTFELQDIQEDVSSQNCEK